LFSEISAEKSNSGTFENYIKTAENNTGTNREDKDKKKLPDQGSPSASTTPTNGDKGVQRE